MRTDIQNEHDRLVALLDEIPSARYAESGVWGEGWSLTDLVAHLAEWQAMFLGWYEAGQTSGGAAAVAAPGNHQCARSLKLRAASPRALIEFPPASLRVMPELPPVHRLAIFDIDGTLTDTNRVDDECFVQSVADVLELQRHHLDWSDAPHVTDTALLRWLADRHGRRVDQTTEGAVRDRFLQLLHREHVASPWRFGPIRGAPSVRAALEKRGWQMALATGAWEPSARLKLEAIGFDTAGVPLASATDAATRIEIVRLALARSLRACGSIERVVSVGDAVWDVQTAVAVGWPFVGVATGARADELRAHGASTIVPDLDDVAALCHALAEAEIPGPIAPVA